VLLDLVSMASVKRLTELSQAEGLVEAMVEMAKTDLLVDAQHDVTVPRRSKSLLHLGEVVGVLVDYDAQAFEGGGVGPRLAGFQLVRLGCDVLAVIGDGVPIFSWQHLLDDPGQLGLWHLAYEMGDWQGESRHHRADVLAEHVVPRVEVVGEPQRVLVGVGDVVALEECLLGGLPVGIDHLEGVERHVAVFEGVREKCSLRTPA